MVIAPTNRQVVVDRLIVIEGSVAKLSPFQSFRLEKFKEGENFPIAEHFKVVRPGRFERPTTGFVVRYSILLSYGRNLTDKKIH